MYYKIGQQIITILNIFNMIVQHTINIFKYHPPCVLFNFAPPIIPLIYVPVHDLNSNASLKLDTYFSHSCYGYTWNRQIACTMNKKSAKLASNLQYPSPLNTYNILL